MLVTPYSNIEQDKDEEETVVLAEYEVKEKPQDSVSKITVTEDQNLNLSKRYCKSLSRHNDKYITDIYNIHTSE